MRIRGAAFVVAGVVVVLATAGLLVMARAGAEGERCSDFRRAASARASLVTGAGADLLVIGDSYSVGLGIHPWRSWPGRLPGRVHVAGFSGSGFSPRASECGAVSYADRAGRALATSDPSLVVVEGGLNDVDQPVADLRAGFDALMAQLDGRQVLVVGPPPAPDRAGAVRTVDVELARLASRWGVGYLSMVDVALPYLDDGLHLTPAGHQQFGDLVADALSTARPTSSAG